MINFREAAPGVRLARATNVDACDKELRELIGLQGEVNEKPEASDSVSVEVGCDKIRSRLCRDSLRRPMRLLKDVL
jgi:hypothetical protein